MIKVILLIFVLFSSNLFGEDDIISSVRWKNPDDSCKGLINDLYKHMNKKYSDNQFIYGIRYNISSQKKEANWGSWGQGALYRSNHSNRLSPLEGSGRIFFSDRTYTSEESGYQNEPFNAGKTDRIGVAVKSNGVLSLTLLSWNNKNIDLYPFCKDGFMYAIENKKVFHVLSFKKHKSLPM